MKTEEFLLFKKHKRLLKSKKQWSLLRFKKILSWVRIRRENERGSMRTLIHSLAASPNDEAVVA